eukprot:11259178-Alexandrium_andersonii.AAC.1
MGNGVDNSHWATRQSMPRSGGAPMNFAKRPKTIEPSQSTTTAKPLSKGTKYLGRGQADGRR